MVQKLSIIMLLVFGLGGCSSVYYDSADDGHGGRFVSGAFEGQKAIFNCPSSGKCKKVKIVMK